METLRMCAWNELREGADHEAGHVDALALLWVSEAKKLKPAEGQTAMSVAAGKVKRAAELLREAGQTASLLAPDQRKDGAA